MDKQKVIAIVGPTGTGKTSLSIQLAKKMNGEIISADSMQVYKGMDIGTAKVTPVEMDGIRHYLVDIQDYHQPYNVKSFQDKCRQAIDAIIKKGKVPILCGGTGLYVKAALYDYEFKEEETDQEVMDIVQSMSSKQLIERLKEKDPKALEKIHPNNRKRLERAAYLTYSDQNKSQREEGQKHEPVFDFYLIGLSADKKIVDERIAQRVDVMFDAGLVREVKTLFADPKSWEYTSFQGIGYKEFKEYFEKKKTLEEVKQDIIVHSRQYAKRQMTWFRNQMPVHWYDLNDKNTILSDVEAWYGKSSAAGPASDGPKRN